MLRETIQIRGEFSVNLSVIKHLWQANDGAGKDIQHVQRPKDTLPHFCSEGSQLHLLLRPMKSVLQCPTNC